MKKTTVRIGHRDYTISFVENLKDEGVCLKEFSHDYEKGWIKIKTGRSDIDYANAMFHEILHAIFTERGLIYSTKTEEKIVLAMTNGIIDFIRDNPRFFKRLLNLLKVTPAPAGE